MNTRSDAVIFRRDWYEAISKREPNVRLELYDAVMGAVFGGETEKELSDIASMALDLLLPQIERDIEKRRSVSEARRSSGRKGGEANGSKTKQIEAKTSKAKQTEANESNLKQNEAKSSRAGDSCYLFNQEDMEDCMCKGEEEKEKVENKFSTKKKENDMSFIDEKYMPVVTDWLAYKAERHESYKPRGLRAFYTRLVKDSGGDPVIARAMIDKAMSANYMGVFPLNRAETDAVLSGEETRKEQSVFPEGYWQ